MITDPRPEGGYQDPKDYEGLPTFQVPFREPPRCMFTAEFLDIVRRNRHSRFLAGVEVWQFVKVQRARQVCGLTETGTLHFYTATRAFDTVVIPRSCIPYSSIKTAVWSERRGRHIRGVLEKGWRNALVGLVAGGYLMPSDELSYLTGEYLLYKFGSERKEE